MHALRAISGRCSLSIGILVVLDLLFPVLTSDYSNEREKELEGGGGAGEGRATAAAATSALAAATAASRCKESCSRGKGQWRRAEGRRVTRKRKIWAGKKEERGWRMERKGEIYLGRAKERPRTWLRSEPTSTR